MQPDRKKQGGGAVPRGSTCHAKKQAVPHVMQKNKLFHMLQKNKLFHMLQKPCKNHAKCGAHGAPTRRTLTLPGFLAICASCAMSHKEATKHPLSPGFLLCVLSVPYLTRQATEHPLSPGFLLCVPSVLDLTRQATEHPLSPGSLQYVLYVLYGPIWHIHCKFSRVQNIQHI